MRILLTIMVFIFFTGNAISGLQKTFVSWKDDRCGIVSTTGEVFSDPLFASLDRLMNNCYWASSNPTNDFSGQVISQFGKPLCAPVFLLYYDFLFPTPPPVLTNGATLLSAKGLESNLSHDYLLYPDGQMIDLGIQPWHYLNRQGLITRRLQNGQISLFDVAMRKDRTIFNVDYILDSGLPDVGIAHENGRFGLVGITGKYILPCSYDSISSLHYAKGLFVVGKNDSQGLFRVDKEWILPLSESASIDTGDFGHLLKVTLKDDTFVLDPNTGKRTKLPADAKIGETAWSSYTYMRNNRIFIGTPDKAVVFSVTNSSIALKNKTSGFYGCGDIWETRENGKSLSSVYVYQGESHYYENARIAEGLFRIPELKCLFLVITETDSKLARIMSVDANRTLAHHFDSKNKMVHQWKNKIIIRDINTDFFSIIGLNGEIFIDFPDKISFTNEGFFGLSDFTHVIHGGKSGLIDSECRFVLPCQYEDVGHFGEGLVPAKEGGKWGFVELPGKWAIPPRFEEARSFKNGFAPVSVGGKWGFIGKEGKPATPFAYEDVKDVREGHFRAQVDGKWGVFALDGTCTLPAEYDRIVADDEPEYGDPR